MEEEVGDLKANLCLVAEQIEGAWKDAYSIRLERSHTSKRLCIAFRHIENKLKNMREWIEPLDAWFDVGRMAVEMPQKQMKNTERNKENGKDAK